MRSAGRPIILLLAVLVAGPVAACGDGAGSAPVGAVTGDDTPYGMYFTSVPPLSEPRRGVLASVSRSNAGDAKLAGTLLRIDVDPEIAPVATLRQLQEQQRPYTLPMQLPAFEDIVVAGQKCPAVLAAVKAVRELSYRPRFGLEDELECPDGAEECEPRSVTFCSSDEYRLEILGWPHIEKRWFDDSDPAASKWLLDTISALRKCPGLTIPSNEGAEEASSGR